MVSGRELGEVWIKKMCQISSSLLTVSFYTALHSELALRLVPFLLPLYNDDGTAEYTFDSLLLSLEEYLMPAFRTFHCLGYHYTGRGGLSRWEIARTICCVAGRELLRDRRQFLRPSGSVPWLRFMDYAFLFFYKRFDLQFSRYEALYFFYNIYEASFF